MKTPSPDPRDSGEKKLKILYAIQGTGNGHLSRARDMIPEFEKFGKVDILISGTQVDMELSVPVTYRKHGLSFIFGRKGGVDIWRTLRGLKLLRLIKDIILLPVKDYDLVVSDFEPVSAWSCKLKGRYCVGLSHQAAVLHPWFPKPVGKGFWGKRVLRHYAPVRKAYGFHFKSYGKSVFTPVIRREVRELKSEKGNHYTVYLPAYDDETLVTFLSRFKEVRWEIFSKHNRGEYRTDGISVMPIENSRFLKSMATAAGVLCGAGFETPAEAMFLEKKLLVIPMEGQYEQLCNAIVLESMGVTVVPALSKKYDNRISWWLLAGRAIPVNYRDHAAGVAEQVVRESVKSKTRN